jgi:two-component system, chemotaxis family, CheB/CheR fusion protein
MHFPIVAIGASAGGLEALLELLGGLAPPTGLAYIAVQHLSPDHESLLPEILAKKLALTVIAAREGLEIEADHLYVIPPNATLTVLDGRLRVSPRALGLHHPVDILFESLARECADRAIAIVLSGGDGDGALGVQQVKQAGGITFAQEPGTARFPSMPLRAIDTGCVDFILSPSQIARELMRLIQHPYLSESVTPESSPALETPSPRSSTEEDGLRRVFRRLRNVHGVDFTYYKRSTLRRRLERRMALTRHLELADYIDLMETDASEAAALYQDFLIRVTAFFRDPEPFEALAQQVFPRLCTGRSQKTPIRIWVPGCATGEEVYSIAMSLVEFLREGTGMPPIQIFGTDVSETAIVKARAGLYLDSISLDVSEERLQRFFVKQNNHYQIAKNIRDLCIFARHDITRDPPFSRLDLISCRNLLIYLDTVAQRQVMQVFHYALRPDGYLLLGPSESVGHAGNLFELIDKISRLHTRTSAAGGMPLNLVARDMPSNLRLTDGFGAATVMPLETDSLQREAERLLLARFVPPSILIDDALNVLQFRGATGPYLEPAAGPPSVSLHRVVRPEMLVEIAPAVQRARQSGAAVRLEGLRIGDRGEITVEVVPLKCSEASSGFLILFHDEMSRGAVRRDQLLADRYLPDSQKDRRLEQLTREITAVREYMQAAMEEHEAVKEELKSTHEEVLSANEEFQSTNEELETAKEELQSANEELRTTNEELRNRNRELGELNIELQEARDLAEHARDLADTIIETVREPLIVLDGKLRVVRVNRAFYTEFNTRAEETENCLLYDLGNGEWDRPELRAALGNVLIQSEPLVDYDVEHGVPGLGLRIMRLNARKVRGDSSRPELILLAIADVTARKIDSERLVRDVQRKDEFLAMLAHELRNPLAPIAHAVTLLRRTEHPAATEKLYGMIERQTRRLIRLVDELLDVARISRGLIELKRERLDFGALVEQTALAHRPRAQECQQELCVEMPDVPICVDADPVRLEQVIANLLDNASKYTLAGGRIVLSLRSEGQDAVLSVRDNGIGLAADSLQSIFDLFSQVDGSPARSNGGLGIGLTLVRRVMELHDGSVEGRSAGLGQGSEFSIRLRALDPIVGARCPATHAPPPVPQVGSKRVLIVEDNKDAADALALLLDGLGHQTAVAADGWSALDAVGSFHPDVALVDIGIPGFSGYELAKRLRSDARLAKLRLIAMTGYGRPEDRAAARAAGFDAHVVKPAELSDLEALIAVVPTRGGD